MEVKLLKLENKKIRARVIKKYIEDLGYKGVVCFSCGNATRELKNIGLNVIDISPSGDFEALHWFTPKQVKQYFPEHFDATSGHLSIELMQLIGAEFKKELGENLPQTNYIATGSGETIVCLKLAYPDKDFIAVYNLNDATKYEPEATLNDIVCMLAKEVIFAEQTQDTYYYAE